MPTTSSCGANLPILYLQMGNQAEAEAAFSETVRLAPGDLLSTAQLGFLELARGDRAAAMPRLELVMASGDQELADRVRTALRLPQTMKLRTETPRSQVSVEAKTLADRSLEKGYLKDALKYLSIAHENDPVDFDVMLKLGWTNNMLHEDRTAVHWFRLASKSPDPRSGGGGDASLSQPGARVRAVSHHPCGCCPSTPRAGMTCSPTAS